MRAEVMGMNYSTVLVFGAHPDDEIQMAGTIARLSGAGVRVVVCTFTDGSEGYPCAEWRAQIVQMRRREAEACDAVLGIAQRYRLERPDMGLTNDKETFKETIRIIRQVRPDAIFTHGPDDFHRDHRAASELSVEAAWQAGEPVAAELGPPWKTPHVLYYKGVRGRLPDIIYDVSTTAHKRWEALATQESQHTLFGKSKEELLAEAERVRQAAAQGQRFTETFWFTDHCHLTDFPPVLR
jgi:LmbE family N-acetylglucosaminyl deacetylase